MEPSPHRDGVLVEHKVIIIGGRGVGKTSLFRHLLRINSETPTLPELRSFQGGMTLSDINCKVSLWDVPGSNEDPSSVHYRNSAVCLLVYDTGSVGSAEDLIQWVSEVLRFSPSCCELILVGNNKGAENHQAKEIVKRLATSRSLQLQTVNTQSGDGIVALWKRIKKSLCIQNQPEDWG
ncbi:hypothetical protein Pelo_4619 [Pelomyxa schiedti]|nr:hypothetical protein Pelo_4619 [Pelomyxa schiedti]